MTDARAPARALRVLLVEDDPDSAQSFALLLELAGHTVRTARDGVAGVAEARQFAPDVAIVDLGLPGIDGFEVARQLRQSDATRGTLLVALSGYSEAEDRARASAAGFDHHLVKPVDLQRIQALLTAAAATHSARR
jgi:CheY-like chemotaxis protein